MDLFETVKLARADLSGANLSGANLSSANMQDAKLSNTTLVNLDLSAVKGLDSVRHDGPSSIGIDTFFRSNGDIPEVFLRGAGVPDSFITYPKSLVGSAIEFYSCFVSYSTRDQGFADRLYADLQAKGVRCWFAPEDLKIGDKFRTRIEESIQLHDKLLLVLSEASIASQWVEDEVESALQRERRENRLVLFPVRIDDAVINTDVAWAVHLRQKRHIGRFHSWKDHDSYRKSFDRLIKDLQAPSRAAG